MRPSCQSAQINHLSVPGSPTLVSQGVKTTTMSFCIEHAIHVSKNISQTFEKMSAPRLWGHCLFKRFLNRFFLYLLKNPFIGIFPLHLLDTA